MSCSQIDWKTCMRLRLTINMMSRMSRKCLIINENSDNEIDDSDVLQIIKN